MCYHFLTRVGNVDLLRDGQDDAGALRYNALAAQPVPKFVAMLHRVRLPKERADGVEGGSSRFDASRH